MSGLMRKYLSIVRLILAVGFLLPSAASSTEAQEIQLSKGQTVYVPIYSHIYSGDQERPFNLTSTLSIRNTDLDNPVTVTEVNYYGSDGRLIKRYIDKPVTLGSLSATRFVVKESDKAGGSGASFIVKWKSDVRVNTPVIESIMISTRSQQGISFHSPGKAIRDASE